MGMFVDIGQNETRDLLSLSHNPRNYLNHQPSITLVEELLNSLIGREHHAKNIKLGISNGKITGIWFESSYAVPLDYFVSQLNSLSLRQENGITRMNRGEFQFSEEGINKFSGIVTAHLNSQHVRTG